MALTANQVQQFYIGYYARPADPVSLTYWQGQTEAAALAGFAGSAEFTNQFTGMSTSQQVTKVYGNLLGRAPDAAGLLYWSGEIAAGRETIGSLVLSMINNALGKDVTTIADRVTYSNAFTAAVNTVDEINAYAGPAATQAARDALLKVVSASTGDHTALTAETAKIDATVAAIVSGGTSNPGQTFTLTSSIDNITGTNGNDIIIGDSTSVGAADQINGGAGTDTLKMYGTVTKAVISNIENIYLNAPGGAFDVSTIAGVTSLEVDAEAGSRAFTVTTGQTVTLSNLQTTAQTQTIAGNTPATLDLTLNKVGKLDGTVTQTVDLSGTALTALNLKTATADSAITLTNTGAKLATLNVTGDKAVTITEALTTLKTIDASAATGNVVIKANVTNDLKFTGGSGNDAIWFGAGQFNNLDTIDLGAGTADKVVVAETAALTATQYAAINGYKGVEVLGLNASGVSVDASKLTAGIKDFAVESGNYTVTVTESLATTKYSVDNSAGNSGTLTITNKTGENSTTLNIDNQSGATQTLATVVATGIANVALSSTGKVNSANTLTTLTNADNSNITITGDRDLTITNALAASVTGSKVDASAFTGKLSVKGSALSDIIIGGSGSDTLDGGAVTHTVATSAATAETQTFTITGPVGAAGAGNITVNGATIAVANSDSADIVGGKIVAAIAAIKAADATVDTVTYDAVTDTVSVKYLAASGNVGDTQTVVSAGTTGATFGSTVVATQGVNAVVAGVVGSVDTLTGGAGADTFSFSTAEVSTTAGAVTAIVTDFMGGLDKIKVGSVGAAGSGANYLEAGSAATTLTALLAAADTALNGTVKYYVGQVGADSYLVTDADGTGYTNVIKLVGVDLAHIAMTDVIA